MSSYDSSSEPNPSLRYTARERIGIFNRYTFRQLFGYSAYFQRGHFIDESMTSIIYSFANWNEYPTSVSKLDHSCEVQAAVVSSDGKYLFTGSADGQIIRTDLEIDKQIEHWIAHESRGVVSLDYHTKGRLISCNGTGNIRNWDVQKSSVLIHTIETNINLTKIMVNPLTDNNTNVFAAGTDGSITVWSIDKGNELIKFDDHSKKVTDLLLMIIDSTPNELLISGSLDQTINIYDLESGECTNSLDHRDICGAPFLSSVYNLSMNCNRTVLACVCDAGIMLFDWPSLVRRLSPIKEQATQVLFHPTKPDVLAVAGALDYFTKTYDVGSSKLVQSFTTHYRNVNGLCFTPDGSRFISVSNDHTVCISPVWYVSK